MDHNNTDHIFEIPNGVSVYLTKNKDYTVKTEQTWVGVPGKHENWNGNEVNYKLNYTVGVGTAPVTKTAEFTPNTDIGSVTLSCDYDVDMSIKDPWFVETSGPNEGEQLNIFHDYVSYINVFPNHQCASEPYYSIKTDRFFGTDNKAFDHWETIVPAWVTFDDSEDYNSCCIEFENTYGPDIEAIYVDVSGAPSTPTNFSVDTSGDHPILSWSSNSEKDMDHYKIRVRYWTRLDPGLGWLNKGTTTDTCYTDTNVDPPSGGLPDFIAYKISAIDAFDYASAETDSIKISGDVINWPARQVSEVILLTDEIPDHFVLSPAYPNPFNPTVNICFGLPDGDYLKVAIYNEIGQKVNDFYTGYCSAGFHTMTWDANQYPSGIYLIRIDSDKVHETQKVILLK